MEQNQEIRRVQGTGRILEYTLTRKNVKNLNMRVKPDGRVLVSANRQVPLKYIDDFVLSQESFILKVWKKYEQRKTAVRPPLQYISGEKISVLGSPLLLSVEISASEGVEIAGETLILRVRDGAEAAAKERLMEKWRKEMQRKVFEEICQQIYPRVQSFGVPYPLIKIRDMRSCWGSCQPGKGVITLNGKMLSVPREAVEYVVLHELVHFIHPDHSKDFYRTVELLMPDWKERRDLLKAIDIRDN